VSSLLYVIDLSTTYMTITRIAYGVSIAVVVTGILIMPGSAHACSCVPPGSQQEELAESDAVFSGMVTSVTNDATATFDVKRVWKGAVTGQDTVKTPENSAMCGFGFQEGKSYVVYASENDDGEWHTTICTRTTSLDNARTDIEELGDARDPANDTSTAQKIKELRQQIEQLQNKLKELQTQARTDCPDLARDLTPGERGEQVSQLQRLLKKKGYFDFPRITGYYGSVTTRAVQAFQRDKSIVNSGNPSTTGYGRVGPKTRSALRVACRVEDGPQEKKPVISSVTPTRGPVGTSITVKGDNFTDANDVHFGPGGVDDVSATDNGTELTFSVPSATGPCVFQGELCRAPMQQITEGSYQVSVSNTYGRSEPVTFTVTAGNGNGAQDDISVSVEPNQSSYTLSDTIEFAIRADNNTDEAKTLTFSTTCQTSYRVGDYDSAQNRICAQAITNVDLAAGETHTWNRTHDLSEHSLPAGEYTLTAIVGDYGSASAKITVEERN